jgi:hypothetical protein
MIDKNARARLAQQQQTKQLINSVTQAVSSAVPKQAPVNVEAKELTQKIGQLTDTIQKQQVTIPKVVSPTEGLANELRALQRVIGQGNLIDSLKTLSEGLNSFELNTDAVTNLRALITDLNTKLKLLTEIEARIPKEIQIRFPKNVSVNGNVVVDSGKIDVGRIDSLPALKITNLDEVSKSLSILINNLQVATIKAIQASKIQFPDSMNVANPVQVVDFSDLLDGIEELKKGFNLLINKEVATVSFPNKTIPVEIQNWMIPQPVTNISLNPNRGTVLATAITVTTSLTPLPGTALADRRSMTLYNNSAATTIFVGGANVTSSSGIPVPAGTYGPSLDAGPLNIVYAVTSSGSADTRVLEMNDTVVGGDN